MNWWEKRYLKFAQIQNYRILLQLFSSSKNSFKETEKKKKKERKGEIFMELNFRVS